MSYIPWPRMLAKEDPDTAKALGIEPHEPAMMAPWKLLKKHPYAPTPTPLKLPIPQIKGWGILILALVAFLALSSSK